MRSGGDLELFGSGDITNYGTISSNQNLSINAGNNFNNLNTKTTIGDTKYNANTQDIITSTGTISATNNLNINIGNSINFIGSSAEAGNISLASQNEINILTEFLNGNFDAVRSTGKRYSATKEQSTTNIGSSLKSGGDITMTSIADLNIHGSSITGAGSGILQSLAGDINITNAIDSKMTHTIDKYKGTTKSTHDEVYDYKETSKESTLDFGGSLGINAGVGDLLVQGSELTSSGNTQIDLLNTTIKAAEVREERWEVHKKNKFDYFKMQLGFLSAAAVGFLVGGPVGAKAAIASQAIKYGMNPKSMDSGKITLQAKQTVTEVNSSIASSNMNYHKEDVLTVLMDRNETHKTGVSYWDTAKSGAITGAIAGIMTKLSAKVNPSTEKGVDVAVYKPSSQLTKTAEFKAQFPNYNGVIDPTANNIGMANTTDKLNLVGTVVEKPQYWYNEGSWFMNGVNKVGGMNNMATNIHDPWVTKYPVLQTGVLLKQVLFQQQWWNIVHFLQVFARQ